MKRIARRFNEVSPKVNFLLNAIFVLYTVICIYPVLLILGTAMSSEASIEKFGYHVIPKEFSLYAFEYVTRNSTEILRAYGLTIFVTIAGTLLSTALICLYAYPLSRKEFKYRTFFAFFIFFTMLFNGGLVPWYMVCTQLLHIQNTVWALIIPMLMNAWLVIIMRTFFSTTIPDALVESARIDGSGEFRTLLSIVLPISLPGIATVSLFTMLSYWNDWWLPLILTTKPELSNLQFYLYRIITNIRVLTDSSNLALYNQGGTLADTAPSESARMAICILAIGPIVLAYPFFQRFFIQGLTIGAVKG